MPKRILILAVCFLAGLSAFAQKTYVSVKGTVLDETGAPLPGVMVYQEGRTDKGATTDGKGTFSLVVSPDAVLVFNCLGFVVGLLVENCDRADNAIDILGIKDKDEQQIRKGRSKVHVMMAVTMAATIFVFNLVNSTSVIDAVYTLASYTYGPILGLFTFGIFCKRKVRDHMVPEAVVLAPVICFILDRNSETLLGGYQFSYELLILNALITILLMSLLILPEKRN